jgi:hypothetical protein
MATQLWRVGEPLPVLMTPMQLRAVLQLGRSRFFAQQRAGLFRRFEVAGAIGHAKYSGLKVQQFVSGAPVAQYGRGSRAAARRAS